VTATTTTIAAMLRAVRESPESMADDTLRLALADVLDETDPSEGGDPAWAEFLRVQVELVKVPDFHPYGSNEQRANNSRLSRAEKVLARSLRSRERALRAEHEARWRRGPACGRCGDAGYRRAIDGEHVGRPYCPDCAGTGHAGPLGDREPGGDARYGGQAGGASRWRVPVEFRRGFIARISTPLADVFAGDDVTPWAVRVARWPRVCLEEWGLTDEGLLWEDEMRKWWWRAELIGSGRPIPNPVWRVLDQWVNSDGLKYPFDTEVAARLALARAVAKVAREAAE
jgi:uncharacterized protein (TIGR02996 family)